MDAEIVDFVNTLWFWVNNIYLSLVPADSQNKIDNAAIGWNYQQYSFRVIQQTIFNSR